MRFKLLLAATTASLLAIAPAHAGVFIIDGTDADDHGFASAGGVPEDGWAYIRSGITNIGSSSGLTLTNKSIAVFGADAGTDAATAINTAFTGSTLALAGWTINFLNDAQISTFFTGVGAGSVNTTNTSMIYIPSSLGQVGGGINGTEEGILTTNAAGINAFLGAGGGLFSHTQSYGWLAALVPGIGVVQGGDTGLTLTAAGTSNFPGLNNGDLSSGPWHTNFTNIGALPVLATGSGGRAVIIGGSGGTITAPPPGAVPEPATWAMMLLGFGMVGTAMRRSRKQTVRYSAV